ncbi:hypothetical protein [Sorangium sp. So ce1153]|uniref:hypothetical protein n=1 Tax=Sorangium sp. So ce1153 TaxID=3133333 RepID=UPI003F6381DC
MGKFDELEAARKRSDEESWAQDRRDAAMMLLVLTELRQYLECPSGGFTIEQVHANRADGESHIQQRVLRLADGRAASLFKLNLPSGWLEIYMRLKPTGGAYEASCFDVGRKIMEHDEAGRRVFYEQIFDAVKRHIENRHKQTRHLLKQREVIGFREPEPIDTPNGAQGENVEVSVSVSG